MDRKCTSSGRPKAHPRGIPGCLSKELVNGDNWTAIICFIFIWQPRVYITNYRRPNCFSCHQPLRANYLNCVVITPDSESSKITHAHARARAHTQLVCRWDHRDSLAPSCGNSCTCAFVIRPLQYSILYCTILLRKQVIWFKVYLKFNQL